jgi:hypothetical protein
MKDDIVTIFLNEVENNYCILIQTFHNLKLKLVIESLSEVDMYVQN